MTNGDNIKIVFPQKGQKISGKAMTVTFRMPEGHESYFLYLDDEIVPAENARCLIVEDLGDRNIFHHRVVVQKPGLHRIRVQSADDERQEQVEFMAEWGVETGQTHAVVIGISHYLSPEIPDLHYAADDAWLFYNLVTKADVNQVAAKNVTLLLDEEATIENIGRVFEALCESMSSEDSLIVYYAGHGHFSNFGGYIIPYDFKKGAPYTTAAFSYETISRIIGNVGPRRAVVLLDSCHSGYMKEKDRFTGADRERALKQICQDQRGVVVITSCRSDQQSFEAEDYHRGLFTHYLIKGLTGEARTDSTSKKISVLDLYNYLNNSLAAECAKRCREQQPDVKGDLTADWALPLRLTNVEDIFVARPHKVIPEPKPEPPPPVEDKCAEEAAQVVEPPVAKSAAPKEAMAQEIRQKIVEGHFREAELALDKYFNNFNEDVNYLFLRGLWAYQQDRLRTAGRYFDSCVRADPGHQEALEGLDNVESRARYYRTMAAVKKKQAEKTGERGDYKKAIGILTSVIETIVPLEDEAERKAIVNRIAELRATKKADIGPAPQTKKHAPVGPPVQLPATLRVGPPPAGGRSMAGVKMGPVASHAEPIVAAQPTFDAPDAEMAPPFEFAPEEPLVEDVYATDAATTPVDPWPVEPTIVETPAAGPTSAYRLRARSRTPAYDTEQTVVFPDESTVVTPVSPPQAEADHHYGKIIAAVVAVTCIIVLIAMVIFLRSSNREAVTAPTARPQSEAVPAPAPKPVAAPAPSPTPAPAAAEEPPHHKPKPPKPPTKTPPPPTPPPYKPSKDPV